MSDLADALRDISPQDEPGRIYGAQYGRVTSVDDPKGLGRVKARVGAQGDGQASDWLTPMWGGASEFKPAIKDPVIVLFVDGDPARGCFAVYAETTTRGRPTEAMLLATTFCGLYNDLAAKFNALKSSHNSLVSTFNAHQHSYLPGAAAAALTVTTAPPATSDADADAAKANAADGSTVGAIASDQTVLSGRAKVL